LQEKLMVSQGKRAPDCIFCKIIRGEIPSARVLDTDHAVAFLDINPVNRGHTLLVPKAHHAQLGELPEPVAAAIGALLPRLCRAVAAATAADGLNVIVNNGSVAGQTIDHCHWHVIPRFHDDSVDWPWPHQAYSGDDLNQMKSRIERELDPHADRAQSGK
jgi:histidine triad (HIT) family protein